MRRKYDADPPRAEAERARAAVVLGHAEPPGDAAGPVLVTDRRELGGTPTVAGRAGQARRSPSARRGPPAGRAAA